MTKGPHSEYEAKVALDAYLRSHVLKFAVKGGPPLPKDCDMEEVRFVRYPDKMTPDLVADYIKESSGYYCCGNAVKKRLSALFPGKELIVQQNRKKKPKPVPVPVKAAASPPPSKTPLSEEDEGPLDQYFQPTTMEGKMVQAWKYIHALEAKMHKQHEDFEFWRLAFSRRLDEIIAWKVNLEDRSKKSSLGARMKVVEEALNIVTQPHPNVDNAIQLLDQKTVAEFNAKYHRP
jgi:hypothetical protein